MKTVGEKIKELLEIRDITQQELAQRSGLSSSLISMLINGKREDITADTAKKLSKALGVHPGYFVEEYTMGPGDFLPHMTPEQKEFVMQANNLQWIGITHEASQKGLSPKKLKKIIDIIMGDNDVE